MHTSIHIHFLQPFKKGNYFSCSVMVSKSSRKHRFMFQLLLCMVVNRVSSRHVGTSGIMQMTSNVLTFVIEVCGIAIQTWYGLVVNKSCDNEAATIILLSLLCIPVVLCADRISTAPHPLLQLHPKWVQNDLILSLQAEKRRIWLTVYRTRRTAPAASIQVLHSTYRNTKWTDAPNNPIMDSSLSWSILFLTHS